jgi:hypothetical protein
MSSTNETLDQRIRERAYALWQSDGSPEGRADEFWDLARRQLEAESDPDAPDMISTAPV